MIILFKSKIILEQTFTRSNVKNLKKATASTNSASDQRIKDLEQRKADLVRLKYDLDRLNADLGRAIEEFEHKIELIESNKL